MNAIIFLTKNQKSNSKFQINVQPYIKILNLGFGIWNLKSGSLKVISLQKDIAGNF